MYMCVLYARENSIRHDKPSLLQGVKAMIMMIMVAFAVRFVVSAL